MSQETWFETHAQLLTDTQSKLIEMQNETADDVVRLRSGMNMLQEKVDRIERDLNVLIGRMEELRDIFSSQLPPQRKQRR